MAVVATVAKAVRTVAKVATAAEWLVGTLADSWVGTLAKWVGTLAAAEAEA